MPGWGVCPPLKPCPILLEEKVFGGQVLICLEHLFHLIYVYLSLPLSCDQLQGGFPLLTFSLPAPASFGHRDLGPQSRELALKVLRSSSCGGSEYEAGWSTSGWALSGIWSWVQLTVLPLFPS